jgi:hypothetical protein
MSIELNEQAKAEPDAVEVSIREAKEWKLNNVTIWLVGSL